MKEGEKERMKKEKDGRKEGREERKIQIFQINQHL